jgi:amidohydrolase
MDSLEQQLITFRHRMHRFPELSNQEQETTNMIRQQLQVHHIKVLDVPLSTGLVAEIGDSGPVVALRADIDALPIIEKSGVAFSSSKEGVMHACGHDIHTSVMLGAAILLKQREDQLHGKVRIVFQPAEEIAEGAKAVLETGVLDDATAIFGFHNDPRLPVGVVGSRHGSLTAGVDRFSIHISGHGSHAAKPHESNDAIIIASHIIQALQTIVSRNIASAENAVLSVTQIHSGNTWNVIPDTAFMEGTVRTFNKETRAFIRRRMEAVVRGIAATYEAGASIEWKLGVPSVNNDPQWTDFALETAANAGYVTRIVEPTSVGEDFSFYQEKLPGSFVMIGSGGPYELHDPKYQADDRMLAPAARYFAQLAFNVLEKLL